MVKKTKNSSQEIEKEKKKKMIKWKRKLLALLQNFPGPKQTSSLRRGTYTRRVEAGREFAISRRTVYLLARLSPSSTR